MRASRLWILALSVSAIAAGCAQEVGDIDRTQPNRIAKSSLEGLWMVQQTVVNVNATAVSSFVGDEGSGQLVVFEPEEDQLVAYRAYEDIIGADALADPNGEVEHGSAQFAFPIQSHFDIQRQYNSSTGEQTNVISENSSDRHWNEREYMRVDWGNIVQNGSDAILAGVVDISEITIQPQDSTDEPTWFIEYDENGRADYIDVIHTYVIEPDYTECVLEFGIPLWGGDCGPERIEVRLSMMRVEESDYQPREYDDYEMNEFGWFQTHRVVYDQRYGSRDSGRIT
ncbi:MAG: hypothetical protein KC561_12400, partial [Myxococcales bacterium]|nr:hypothetical protein [Myxococcales bacterium]